MALGDKKYKRGRGGSGMSEREWDKMDRERSRRTYENVLSQAKGDVAKFLEGLGDDELISLRTNTRRISRFGNYDWNRLMGTIGEGPAARIRQRVKDIEDRKKAERDVRMADQEAIRREKYDAQTASIRREVLLTAGVLRSDLKTAFRRRTVYDLDEGDWLEDPVDAYLEGTGYAEEVMVRGGGIKVQVTVSIDMSNSQWRNDTADAAIVAYRELCLSLEELSLEFPGQFYHQSFIWAMHEDGKGARRTRASSHPQYDDLDLGTMEQFRYTGQPYWAGEDTWLYPLLTEIEKWENEESDPGAVRLDIVITDGVLEHPTDIRRCNEIQGRRDGDLQTVLVNFLPVDDWYEGKLPDRCVQYHCEQDSIAGLMRNLLSEFVAVHL